MSRRSVAVRAILLELKAIRSITAILLRNIVAVFALLTSERNLWTYILRLACHGIFLTFRLKIFP